VLTLCARSGLAQVGVIAVDGTKVQANASRNENLDYEQLAREIVEEAIATDAAEDGSMASAGATSCHRSSRPPLAGAVGCGRPRSAWKNSATRTRSRCRVTGPSG
jgi:hypothetical protein